jgi:hypothetical protein
MKVITMSITDEGCYNEHSWWRLLQWAFLMKVITMSIPDEGYYNEHSW